MTCNFYFRSMLRQESELAAAEHIGSDGSPGGYEG